MSARAPRLHFAAPFVVTLASAATACVMTSSSGQPLAGTSGSSTATDHRGMTHNPPAPGLGSGTGTSTGTGTGSTLSGTSTAGSGSSTASTGIIANPPRPAMPPGGHPPTGVSVNPAPPASTPGTAPVGPTTTGKPTTTVKEPAGPMLPTFAQTWTVTRQGKGCQALVEVSCPAGTKCNPPPPVTYVCPTGLSLDRPLVITRVEGQTTCNAPAGAARKTAVPVDCPTH